LHQFSGWLARLLQRKNLTSDANVLVRSIFGLIRNNGLTFTVSYLKESVRITYHWMAGKPIKTCEGQTFVSISKFGLPTIIKPFYMRFIKGDKIGIQFTLFILSWYRIFEVPGKLKLNTITDPSKFKEGPITLKLSTMYDEMLDYGKQWMNGTQIPSIKKAWPFFAATKTPSGLNAFLAIPTSFRAFTLNDANRNIFTQLQIINLKTGSYTLFGLFFLFNRIMKTYQHIHPWLTKVRSTSGIGLDKPKPRIVDKLYIGWQRESLGRLAEKLEAAGKIRVFAMVDPLTQWTLRPLHLQLFQLLEQFEFDGTKDQLGKAMAFSKKYVGKPMYSLDISAATDRIPMEIYRAALIPIWGSELYFAWESALVDRTYEYTTRMKDGSRHSEFLLYGAGQPMGALSSWASLAFVHHFIVNFAANKIGLQNFQDYIILGDDLVIANKQVAISYLDVMETFGVGINLSKSLISESGVMEFAKRIWYNGEIFSAIPPRDAFLAYRHAVLLPNFIRGLARDVMLLPVSFSIKFLIEHFGVNYDPNRTILSLPKALIGALVELIGVNSVYQDENTAHLILSLARSRIRDVQSWFQGRAHAYAPDLLIFRLLDAGYFRLHIRENVSPLSWAKGFKAFVNDSGIGISTLESWIISFWGLLIEIPDIIKYRRMYRQEISQSLPTDRQGAHLGNQGGGGFAGNIRDSYKVDTTPLLGKRIEYSIHGTGGGLRYFVYSQSPLSRSPLSKVNLDWADHSVKEVKDAYKGARAKARMIRTLGRPYLELPPV